MLGVILTACKSTVNVSKPDESYVERKTYNKEVSVVNVPIEIPLEEIEGQINKHLQGVLFEDKSYSDNEGDNIKYVVKKYAPFKLAAVDNRLLIAMPLDISGSYSRLGAVVNFKGTLKANYMTTITLKDDWELETETKLYSYDWIKAPELDLGWINVPVKWITDRMFNRQETKVNAEIDEAVQEYIHLEEIIEPVFSALTAPMNVSEEYNCWLTIEPIEVFTTPLNFQDEILSMTVGMHAYTETVVGKPDSLDSVVVAPMKVLDSIPGDFNMDLVTVMPFEEASLVLYEQFVKSGYVYEQGKYHLNFTRVNLFGHEGKLVIEAGLQGSIRGEVYLIGDPYYDPVERIIKLENLDFHFKSKQALLKSADWLAHDRLCRVMEKNMYFEIGTELDAVKIEAEEYLNDYQPLTGVLVNGDLSNLEAQDVYLVKDAMVLVISAKGALNITVNGLEE